MVVGCAPIGCVSGHLALILYCLRPLNEIGAVAQVRWRENMRTNVPAHSKKPTLVPQFLALFEAKIEPKVISQNSPSDE